MKKSRWTQKCTASLLRALSSINTARYHLGELQRELNGRAASVGPFSSVLDSAPKDLSAVERDLKHFYQANCD